MLSYLVWLCELVNKHSISRLPNDTFDYVFNCVLIAASAVVHRLIILIVLNINIIQTNISVQYSSRHGEFLQYDDMIPETYNSLATVNLTNVDSFIHVQNSYYQGTMILHIMVVIVLLLHHVVLLMMNIRHCDYSMSL